MADARDDERFEQLQTELARMRPRPMEDGLRRRIERDLASASASASASGRLPRSDRFLIGAISAGAIAACVIAAILFGELSGERSTGAAPIVATAPGVPRFGDSLQALARADDPAWPGVR